MAGGGPPSYNQLMGLLTKVYQCQLAANDRFTQLMELHEKTLRTVTQVAQSLKILSDNSTLFKPDCVMDDARTTIRYVPASVAREETWNLDLMNGPTVTATVENDFTILSDVIQTSSTMTDVRNDIQNNTEVVTSEERHDDDVSSNGVKRARKKFTTFKGGSVIWQYYDFYEEYYACNVDGCGTKYFSARPHVPTAINHLRTSHPNAYKIFLEKSKTQNPRKRTSDDPLSSPSPKRSAEGEKDDQIPHQ
jgi:hypothetical protein